MLGVQHWNTFHRLYHQLPETRNVSKCHLEVDWTTQRSAVETHAVFIWELWGSSLSAPTPKDVPSSPSQSSHPRDPGLLVQGWGTLSVNYSLERKKRPNHMGEEETQPPIDCSISRVVSGAFRDRGEQRLLSSIWRLKVIEAGFVYHFQTYCMYIF